MAAAMLLDSLPSGDIEMHANVSGSDFEGWETSMEAEGDVQTEATEEVDMYDADDDTLDLDTYEMAEDSALQPEYLDDDVEFYDASPHNDPPLNEFEEEEDSPVLDLTDTTTANTDHLVHTDAAAENDLDVSLDPAVAAETIEQDIYSTHLTHDPETLVPLEGPWVVEHIPADQELATEAVHLPLDHKDNQPILSSQPDLGPVSTLEQPLASVEQPSESKSDSEHAETSTHLSENLVVPAEHVAGENLPPPAETHEAALSELDPHEIDDGIYIDPPPAVLLRLPSESSEVYLFNQPIASGSGTSTPSSSRASPHPFPVLLQPLPTLYYEPISSLLESLRLESAVTSLPDVGSSELAIEAIDLKLSVTEDNIHAREVSLHDLNVLHDGSGLSGPLRLRLYLLTPRFILRYRALEREVNTLLLEEPTRADEGDQNQDLENVEPAGNFETQYEEGQADDIHQHEDFENFQPPQNESTNENDIPNTDEEPSSITVGSTLEQQRPVDALHADGLHLTTEKDETVGEESTEFLEVYGTEHQENDGGLETPAPEEWVDNEDEFDEDLDESDQLTDQGQLTEGIDASLAQTHTTDPTSNLDNDPTILPTEPSPEPNEDELDQLQQRETSPYLDNNPEHATEVEAFPENEADDQEEQASVQSSVTLGSTQSGPQRKRSFDEINDEVGENEELTSSDSPEKRARIA